MDLLSIGFAILLVKIVVLVFPGLLGLFFLLSSTETKRKMRNNLCWKLFGESHVFSFKGFVRFLNVLSGILIVISVALLWFILLEPHFGG